MAMTGKTLVDGFDIYAEYGVYITSGGWNGLVAMPSLKTPDSNDWQEEDGVEEDLSAPVLDTKEATVSFACSSSASRLFDFIAKLSDGAYHEFECLWIGRTYKLRLVSQSKLSYNPALGTFSLKLADDFPVRDDYRYKEPFNETVPESDDYLLLHDPDIPDEGAPLTDYGVRVLSGTLSNVLSTPEVKKNLLRNIASEEGADYDGDGPVTLKGKDVKLQCLMRAADLDGLWRNWDALLHDLTLPGERGLWVAAAGQTFPCRYKSCSVTAFSPEGRPWLQFTLTMAFTRDLRVYMGDWLLSSEAGALVTTEDGEDCIDMRPSSPLTAGGATPASVPSGLSVETYADGDDTGSGIRKVKVSELDECSDLTGLWTLGTDSSNDSVKVSLEFVGEAAANANSAATNANAAAQSAESAASNANDAAANANQAAQAANDAAQSVGDAAARAEAAAQSANEAASNANGAAETANAAAKGADSAATNANAAAQAAYEAIEALGDIANIQPITDEEIDGLLENFRFIDSFTVSAEGEYPLTLDAQNTADGADITGSVDISEIPEDDITRIFNNG